MTKSSKPSKPSRLIDRDEVLRRVPLEYSTIYRLMRANDFPQARIVGGRSAWLESEIEAWIANRPARGFPPRGRLPLLTPSPR
ncbi:AlpA family phage regulatory protein [Bradyrhizobium sp. UFLA05-153]